MACIEKKETISKETETETETEEQDRAGPTNKVHISPLYTVHCALCTVSGVRQSGGSQLSLTGFIFGSERPKPAGRSSATASGMASRLTRTRPACLAVIPIYI